MPFTLKTKRKKRLPIKRNARRVKEFRSLKDVLKNLDIKKYSYKYENEDFVGNEKGVGKSSENIRKSYSEKEMPTDDEKKLALEVSNKGRHISCKSLKKNSKSFKITPNQQQQQQHQERQQQLQQQQELQLLLQRQLLQRRQKQKHPSLKTLFPVYPVFSLEGLPFDRGNPFQESTSSDVLNDCSNLYIEYTSTYSDCANPYNECPNADNESASADYECTNTYTKSPYMYNECESADCECVNADNDYAKAENYYANADNEHTNADVLFVSLDFLNDCHKHKKKNNRSTVQVKKSKNCRKSMRKTSGHHNRFPHKIPKIQKFQKYCEKKKECDKTLTQNRKRERRGSPPKKPDVSKKSKETTTTTKETDSSFVCLDDPKTNINDPSVLSLDLWPCFQKGTSSPEEGISKINKKYLQALLMSCRREELKSKHQPKREDSRQAGRTYDKKKKRPIKTNNSKTIKCNKSIEKNGKSRCKCGSPNCVADTDSSEIQNPSLGVKNKFLGMKIPQVLAKYDTPRTKPKKTCPEKRETTCKKKMNSSEIKDHERKNRRKEKTNSRESNDKPCFLEGDVKEIWVRDMGKESVSSITSQISSAMAVNEELYNTYNMGMQSYSKLKRIVETEIARISKNPVTENEKNCRKPEEKKPIEDKTERKHRKMPTPPGFFVKISKEPKSEGDGERMPDKPAKFLRTYTNQIAIPITKTFSEMFAGNGEDLDFVVKKRMHQAERQKQINCNQELKETKEKSASHNHFHEGVFENIKSKLRTLGEGKNVNENIPGEIIKNWSILHRLEKAFLALGTPNFQNKKRKDPNMPQPPLKSTGGPNEPGSEKPDARKKKPESCEPDNDAKRKPLVGDGNKNKIAPKVSTAAEPEKLEQISRKPRNISRRREGKADEFPAPICCASPNYWEENSRKTNAHGVLDRKIESCLKRSPTRGRPQSNKHRKETDPVNLSPTNVTEREESNAKPRRAKFSNNQGNRADPVGVRPSNLKPPRRSDDHDVKPLSDGGKKSRLKFKLITNDVVSPKKFSRLQSRKLGKKKVSNCSECNSTHLPNAENVTRPKSIAILSKSELEQDPPEKSKSNDKAEENSDAFDSKDFLLRSDCKGFLDNLSNESMDIWKMFDEKEKLQLETFGNKFKSSETLQADTLEEFAPKTPAKDVPAKKIFGSSEKVGKPDSEKENVDSAKVKTAQEKPIAADVPQKIVRAWKELNNYWYDREVKERSILSMRGNQPTTQVLFKKFNHIKTKPSHDLASSVKPPTPAIKDLHVPIRKNQSPSSTDFSKLSSNTCDVDFLTVKKTPLKGQISSQEEYKQDYPAESSVSVLSSETYAPVPSDAEAVESEEKGSKAQAQWEQDINCYRTIVKDIINQYKRTDGFLKHREGLRGPEQNDESLECLTGSGTKSKSNSFVENPEDVDIQEYRKKIVSEYEAVPIFEYKSRKGRKTKVEEARKKRKLPVNKVNTEMDLDVKDYQPNVHKVLGSQIYVDVEDLNNRKPKEKHPSLQKVFCKNIEKITEQDELLDTYQRTLSLPKAFVPLPPGANNLGAP